jgi:acetyltransferase
MTIRNLDFVFAPKSIGLIGASRRAQSVGLAVAKNLFHGGFDGPIMPVNPHEAAIEGALAYKNVASLPITPDLAVIATPPDTIPGLIDALGQRGTKGAVVLTAGFGELGAEGRKLQAELLQAAKPYLMRIVGPNCLGIAVPGLGLNASFAPGNPLPGEIAFVAQSGAILTSVLDWARGRGIGFSHVVSLGDMADIDFGDMLDYLAEAAHVRAILLYVEAVTNPRKFMSAARRAARLKPVIVVKAGRRAEGAKAAASHTGAMAGADDVVDAAFRRAGLLRVYELEELFTAVETLAAGITVSGDRLAIITNGGGIGVMATDYLIDQGGRLADLSAETLAKLDAVLPRAWSKGNPVDIIGDAPGARYGAALSAVLEDPGVDGILVMNCPTGIADSSDAARAVVEYADKPRGPELRGRPKPALLSTWLGGPAAQEGRQHLVAHHIPTYETPELAVRAFMHLVRYRKNQELLRETPAPLAVTFIPDSNKARTLLSHALEGGREWLSEPEAKAVLLAYGIPVARTLVAHGLDGVHKAADSLIAEGVVTLAIKILSADITHKSDVGGVALGLGSATEAVDAAKAMLERVAKTKPDARIEGFSVQEMIRRPDAVETIVGMATDPTFGPVILFGQGGTAVERVADKAVALVPLNDSLARDLIAQTRIARVLDAYRGKPAADLAALSLTLVRLSQLVIDAPEIVEIDINPLLVDAKGVVALDGRIRVQVPVNHGHGRLAIRAYPQALEDTITVPGGRNFDLRPIRPEDAPLLQAMIEKVTPEDSRLRFFSAVRQLAPQMAARLSQIDYDREMALVALDPQAPNPEIVGVVRITADPDGERAEYAVLVRSDLKGLGLGWKLMKRILAYAQSRGIKQVFGHVLRENATMIAMAKELGFSIHAEPDDPSIVMVTCDLPPATAENPT